MLQIIDYIKLNQEYFILGLLAGIVVLLILMICINLVQGKKLKTMKRNYDFFMKGKNAETLEEVMLNRFEDIDSLIKKVSNNEIEIGGIKETLKSTYQKIGIVKYNAFKEMGGKLSFSLALLDSNDNGFIVNAMHSREGCYTYIKEIIKGESYIVLGEEEKEALDMAVNFNNFKK